MIQSYLVYVLFIIWSFHWLRKLGQIHKGSLWVDEAPITEVIFVALTENPSVVTTDIQGPRKYPHHRKKAVGTQFQEWHGTKTVGEGSWLLPPSSVFLLPGGRVKPENTYSCILKVKGQVWESQNRINISILIKATTNIHLPKSVLTDLTLEIQF